MATTMKTVIYLPSIKYLVPVANQVLNSRQITRHNQYLLTMLLQDFSLSNQELGLIEQISQAIDCGMVSVVD